MRFLCCIFFVLNACQPSPAIQKEAPKESQNSPYALDVIPPDGGSLVMDISESPEKGKDSAKVVVVEYSNFRCKPCARMASTLEALAKKHPDHIRVIFKHGLLGEPSLSYLVHEAAQAAHAQGKFWEYKRLLFSKQMNFAPANLRSYAKELGLDVQRFDKELNSHLHRGVIERDFYEADLFGHRGTPVIYINGKGYFGVPHTEIASTIEEELKAACALDQSC